MFMEEKMKGTSLKSKLIIGGILAVVIPVIVLGVISIKQASKTLTMISNERALQIAIDISELVDSDIQNELRLSKALAKTPIVTNTAKLIIKKGIDQSRHEISKLNEYFDMLIHEIGKNYDIIFLTDKNGVIFAKNIHDGQKIISISNRDYFNESKNGKSIIGSPVWSKIGGRPVCVTGSPVKNDKGDFIGMLGIVINLGSLYEKISNIKVGQTGYPFVVDNKGVIIVHPNKEHILKTDLTKLPNVKSIIQRMMSKEKGVGEYEFEGIEKIAGFAPVYSTGWSVGVTQAKSEFMSSISFITQIIIVSVIIFLIIIVVGILYFTNTIVLPINWIVDGLGNNSDYISTASYQLLEDSKILYDTSEEQFFIITDTISEVKKIISDENNINDVIEMLERIKRLSKNNKQCVREFLSVTEKMKLQSENMIMSVNELIAVVDNNKGKVMR